MDIDILYDSRNYTIIRDNLTKQIWLYSYQRPIAMYDTKNCKLFHGDKSKWTQTNKFHFANWKDYLKLKKD